MEKNTDDWFKLYKAADSVRNDRKVSPFIEAGGVAAAILTKSGNVYVGICIDTACSLGMCAERNAIANMLTNGENEIEKVVAVMPDGKVGLPCGACRELMMQLSENSGEIEILTDYENHKTVRLKDLMSEWWGKNRFKTEF
jgi:cytidine deaminase